MSEKKFTVDKKAIIIAAVSVVVMAACVIFAVAAVKNRKYDTVDLKSGTSKTTTAVTSANAVSQSAITVKTNLELPKELDVNRFVKQGYELSYIFGVPAFQSEGDISENRLAQYAFCYLFSSNACLVDTAVPSMTYREATVKQIEQKITELFGACTADVKNSDLYNAGKGKFEMWQSNYKSDVFADVSVTSSGSDEYQLTVTYYSDSSKSAENGSHTLKIRKGENGYFISSMN